MIGAAIYMSNSNPKLDTTASSDCIQTYMQQQIDMGPRIPGTNASLAFQDWIFSKVANYPDYSIKNYTSTYKGVELRNFLISSGDSMPPYLFGAHYDSRARATNDPNPDNRNLPVPGANDGASGVAAILELLNHMPTSVASQIGFVLFDGEDQGTLGMIDENGSSWQWIVGSTNFVNALTTDQRSQISAFILFDMIANPNLIIKRESGSNTTLFNEFSNIADQLGYSDVFTNKDLGYGIEDDHQPFLAASIPSLDIIDDLYNYPQWHTIQDDMAHVNPQNVAKIVDVSLGWLKQKTGTDLSSSTAVCPVVSTSSTKPTITSPTSSQESTSTSRSNSGSSPITWTWLSGLIAIPLIRKVVSQRKSHLKK